MVQRYEQTRKLQWYKRGAAYHLWVPISWEKDAPVLKKQ